MATWPRTTSFTKPHSKSVEPCAPISLSRVGWWGLSDTCLDAAIKGDHRGDLSAKRVSPAERRLQK